jgi:hypothetical protein
MIAKARALPGGDAANIAWIVGRVEDVRLVGPFSCALAAESFHWFDSDCLCRSLHGWVPSSRLVLIEVRRELRAPWSDQIASLIADFSTNRDFQPYELVAELTSRGCFSAEGRMAIGPNLFQQSVDDYITSIHSRNGFSRDRMSAQAARQFDAALRDAVSPYAQSDILELHIETRVAWGRVLNHRYPNLATESFAIVRR